MISELPNFERIFETPESENFFQGYFNQNVISADNKRLLAMKVENISCIPDGSSDALIGYFDIDDGSKEFKVFGKTNSFNWQQGSMLQFLGPDFSDKVIWNFFDGCEYKSAIHSFSQGKTDAYPAIYCVSNCGNFALSVDFERHAWFRRGYSYGNIFNENKKHPAPEHDGIWLIDLTSGQKKQIVTLKELRLLNPISTMENAIHYVEHLLFNPKGDQFVFLHRWKHENGIHTRLLSMCLKTSTINIVNDSGRMSHFSWINNEELLGYGALDNGVNRLRKKKLFLKTIFKFLLPVYKMLITDSSKISKSLTGDTYLILNISNPDKNRKVQEKLRSQDGHPVVFPGYNFFVTDTYSRASLNEKAKLYVASLSNKDVRLIDSFGTISEYDESPLRCDLHPCISRDCSILSIDTMDKGVRSVYAYKATK